ncbi:MAG: tripartite tricarboxylate transporter substrate binding protein [Sheuella sp.]|nr:tripartite tricarboxylate transporter substrate binding protein [Sheuella sp.]
MKTMHSVITQSIKKSFLALFTLAIAGVFLHKHAAAQQNWPQQPVTLVVGYAPGGTTDIIARIVANTLASQAGQSFIVENKAGASSNIGAENVANATPNGTRFYIGSTANAINKSLYKNLNYDIEKDLLAVAMLGTVPNMLVVNPGLPINSVKDYIDYAKKNPGKLTCASSGAGSAIHMSCELFKIQTGTDILHVPYKGSNPALTDLLGGQVNSIFDNMPSVLQQVRAGKLRALGVTTQARSSFAPDIPTLAESGLPDFSVQAWFGLFAPAGTSKEMLQQINAAIQKAMLSGELKKSFDQAGIAQPVAPNSVETFSNFVSLEVKKWAEVVQKSGAQAQ